MFKKPSHILLLVILLMPLAAFTSTPNNIRLELKLTSQEQTSYDIGEQLDYTLTAIQSGKYCDEGVSKIKLYTKGAKISNEQDWVQHSDSTWSKAFSVRVVGNKKGELQVTAFRKTDKGNVIVTDKIKLKE